MDYKDIIRQIDVDVEEITPELLPAIRWRLTQKGVSKDIINQFENQVEGRAQDGDKDIVLQLGDIDLRRLGGGEYLSDSLPFSDWTGSVSIHIAANSTQEVFKNTRTQLYDCSVEGASRAFIKINGGKKLIAKNCTEVLTDSARPIEDSIALNCGRAFYNTNVYYNTEVSNCIAESCDGAFNHVNAQNSVAINCRSVFTRLREESANLSAEYCDGTRGRLFTEYDGTVVGQRERTRRNLVAKNVTGGLFGSIPSNYRAGKRFGKYTGYSADRQS